MVVNVHPIKRDFDTYVQLKLLDKHGELGITMIKKTTNTQMWLWSNKTGVFGVHELALRAPEEGRRQGGNSVCIQPS